MSVNHSVCHGWAPTLEGLLCDWCNVGAKGRHKFVSSKPRVMTDHPVIEKQKLCSPPEDSAKFRYD
jgi:hypothetical protein